MNWMSRMVACVSFPNRAAVQGGAFALAAFAATGVFARSITDAEFTTSNGMTTVNVTFEAGQEGDAHALYIACDTTDQGASIADWSAFQRIGPVAKGATSASFTLSSALKASGMICRVFLVEDALPYDTLIDAIRQTGTQYIDTGITAGPTTFASLDFQFASTTPTQQRVFGVASDDGTSLFTFDAYINGGGNWASACKDGSGDWTATGWAAALVRMTISLDAATGLHVLSNHVSRTTTSVTHTGTRTATAAGAITIFARRSFTSGVAQINLIANGGLIYSGVISNAGALARNYLPCKRGERAGLYDSVSGTIFWSAVADDDFTPSGESAVCQPTPNETQIAVSDPIDLDNPASGTIWKGTVNGNWNNFDANWTVNGLAGQLWANGAETIFNDNASTFTVNIPSGSTVTPGSVTFNNNRDYTLAGDGAIAGTGTFSKFRDGQLTISGVNHSFTGDILIAGGTTVLTGDKDENNITSGAFGNPRVARTITVSNATLRVTGKNPIAGGGRSTTPIRAALRLVNSTLETPANFPVNLGDVYLHNSNLILHGGLYTWTHWGSISADNLYFSGNRAMTIAGNIEGSAGNQHDAGLLFGKFGQATVDVPDMTGNANVDVNIKVPIFRADGEPCFTGGFRKTGAGTLELGGRDNESHASRSDYTGNVDVVEGTLRLSWGAANYPLNRTSAFGAVQYPHTFTVHPGATLNLAANDLQGQFYATNFITTYVNGGTLAQNNGLVNGLGRLILENAKLTYQGVNAPNNYYLVSADGFQTSNVPVVWPTLGFNGGVEFLGTNTYTLANGNKDGVHSHLFFGTDDGRPSDCHVAEISGGGTVDDTPDVTVNARLEDAPPWYSAAWVGDRRYINGITHPALPLNMRKTGPGMLQLNSKLSTTTGRIEVAEGTLKMGSNMGSGEANFECPTNTLLGDLRDPNRIALVLNGGTLWLTGNDTFGQANTVNSSTFAVTNGTIRQTEAKVNALPALDLYDATFNYSGHNAGNGNDIATAHPWGTFIFSQRVHFDGTRPYDLQPVGGKCYFSLGWQADSYQVPSGDYTEQHGKTEFCVEDITTNADVDVTIGVVLKFPDRWYGNDTNHKYRYTNFRTGLLKTGPGTLRLNCTSDEGKYYTEATRVNGGALLVDTAVFKSTNVIVQAGAYLGGTGTVPLATIEAGGGFTAAPGQTGSLTLNAVQLPVGAQVALDIPFIGDEEEMNGYRVPVVKAAGLESAKWNVTVNGEPVPTGFSALAVVHNGVVYGSISRGGSIFMVR